MNRQEAIAELENLAWVQGGANRDKATEAISIAIKALKEPPNDWIPCSKRLPGDGTYLVYAPDYQGGSSRAKE